MRRFLAISAPDMAGRALSLHPFPDTEPVDAFFAIAPLVTSAAIPARILGEC
jgi:hypothetical protein